MAEIASRDASAQAIADALLRAVEAIDKPRQDNCSVIVAKVG